MSKNVVRLDPQDWKVIPTPGSPHGDIAVRMYAIDSGDGGEAHMAWVYFDLADMKPVTFEVSDTPDFDFVHDDLKRAVV